MAFDLIKLLLVTVVALATNGCSSSDHQPAPAQPTKQNPTKILQRSQPSPPDPSYPPPPQQLPPIENRVDVIFEAKRVSEQNESAIQGWTNLPFDSKLWFLVVDPRGVAAQKNGTYFVVGQGGYFRIGPLGPAEGIPPGTYTLRVGSVVAQMQPPNVRAVIGKNGENLRGPLIESDGGTLYTEFSFTIGGEVGNELQQKEFEQDASLVNDVAQGIDGLFHRLQSNCDKDTAYFVSDFQTRLRQLQGRLDHTVGGSPSWSLWEAGNALSRMPSDKPGCAERSDEESYQEDVAEFHKFMAEAKEKAAIR